MRFVTILRKKPILQFRLVTLFAVVTVIALVLGGWQALTLWNKSDFCRGWAEHYAREAARYRQLSLDPSVSESESAARRDAALEYDQVSAIYARVAAKPWLSYPSKSKEGKSP